VMPRPKREGGVWKYEAIGGREVVITNTQE
jgi:hypothetical protein